MNADREDSDIIEGYFEQKLEQLGYSVEINKVWVPTRIAAQWMGEALGKRVESSSGGRQLRQLIRAGHVTKISESKHHGKKRGVFWWPSSTPDDLGTFGCATIQESVPEFLDVESRILTQGGNF